jgi:hypothetical protein
VFWWLGLPLFLDPWCLGEMALALLFVMFTMCITKLCNFVVFGFEHGEKNTVYFLYYLSDS